MSSVDLAVITLREVLALKKYRSISMSYFIFQYTVGRSVCLALEAAGVYSRVVFAWNVICHSFELFREPVDIWQFRIVFWLVGSSFFVGRYVFALFYA